MTTNTVNTSVSILDKIKIVFAMLCVLAGVYAFYHFNAQSQALRFAYVGFGLVAGWFVFYSSQTGKGFWRFAVQSRIEIRKVFWPTRQEAMQTTLVVIVFTAIMAVFFLILDFGLIKAVPFLTGQGGS